MSAKTVSRDSAGNECRFITLFVISHGRDIRSNEVPPRLANKIHKLMLAGLSGHITQGSVSLDTLFFNAARMLAHDRTMHHVEQLHETRREILKCANIKKLIQAQQVGQEDYVVDEVTKGRYQRGSDIGDWLPEPSEVLYDREYDLNANPFGIDDDTGRPERHKLSMEANQFGIWAANASVDIARSIGLLPGIQPTAISMMSLLEMVPSTARINPEIQPDTTGTVTTLFEVVDKIHAVFGENTYVNVIDMCCRAFWDWDSGARERHARIARLSGEVTDKIHRLRWLPPPVVPSLVKFANRAVNYAVAESDDVPSTAVNPTRVPEIIDIVEATGERVVYWDTRGNVYTRPDYPRDTLDLSGIGIIGIGSVITLPNGYQFTVFYIFNGWLFVHGMSDDGVEHTYYFTWHSKSKRWHIEDDILITGVKPPYEYIQDAVATAKKRARSSTPTRKRGGRRRSVHKRSRWLRSRNQKRNRRVKTKKMN
jgi:hypothetical protein